MLPTEFTRRKNDEDKYRVLPEAAPGGMIIANSVLNVYYPNETRAEILISLRKKGCWEGELVYYTEKDKPVYVLATMLQIRNGNEVIKHSLH